MVASTSGLPNIKLRLGEERHELQGGGLVYYLERTDGAVKIGTTSNYPRRRTELVQRHGPLRLVAWEQGYYEVEERRHEQFAHLRIDRSRRCAEWFRVDDELFDHIVMLLALL